ncbi:hypothetical protein CsSME_00038691 [Camellia sinensis var. sinensis]
MATELVDIPVFKTCPHFEVAMPSPSFHSRSYSVFALEGTAFAPNLDLGTTGLQVLLRSKKLLRPSKEPVCPNLSKNRDSQRTWWFGTLHDRAKVKLALRDRASSYTCHPFPAESKWTTDHYRDTPAALAAFREEYGIPADVHLELAEIETTPWGREQRPSFPP